MKTKLLIFSFVACFFFSLSGNAQIVKQLTNKAVNKSLNKLKEKVKPSEDQNQDNTNQNQQSDQNQSEQPTNNTDNNGNDNNQPMNNAGFNVLKGLTNGTPVNVEKAYTFATSIAMDIETTDLKKKETMKMNTITYVNEDNKNFAMDIKSDAKEKGKPVSTMMVYDYKNFAIITLSEENGQKSGIIMGFEPTEESAENEEDKGEELKFTKTGRTKTIIGYNCEEYVGKNSETEMVMWMTQDLKYDVRKGYGSMGIKSNDPNMPNGFALEVDNTDLKEKHKVHMIVTAINTSSKTTFDTSGYQLVNMGRIKVPQGK